MCVCVNTSHCFNLMVCIKSCLSPVVFVQGDLSIHGNISRWPSLLDEGTAHDRHRLALHDPCGKIASITRCDTQLSVFLLHLSFFFLSLRYHVFHACMQCLDVLRRTAENIKDPLFRFFEREVREKHRAWLSLSLCSSSILCHSLHMTI